MKIKPWALPLPKHRVGRKVTKDSLSTIPSAGPSAGPSLEIDIVDSIRATLKEEVDWDEVDEACGRVMGECNGRDDG